MLKAPNQNPLVSIIVNNYNYGTYLRECVDSALSQTYSYTEVIVVDDGSTDDSRKIIESYSKQIISIMKKNGGQGSAFNAGFSIARGEIVIFLDSDDALLPDVAQRVVTTFQADPGIAKVQYRLEVVDGQGTSLGRTEPLMCWKMPSGDMRKEVTLYHNFTAPPASGNAYSASGLRQILPMPEDLFVIAADAYVNPLIGVLGTVVSLDEIGGRYRRHGQNDTRPRMLDLSRIRENLIRRAAVRRKQQELFRKRYAMEIPKLPLGDVTCMWARMISLRLDPENHPFSERSLTLCLRGCVASLIFPRIRWYRRIFSIAWFLAMVIAPTTLARSLSEKLYYPSKRGVLI